MDDVYLETLELVVEQTERDAQLLEKGEHVSGPATRRETAACRKARLDAGLPAEDGPNVGECRSSCANIVYIDRNIAVQRRLHTQWEAAAADPLSPRPLRDRAAALAESCRVIIAAHHDGQASNTSSKES
ncbi:hypothetical protein [Streptomyces rugosispiralis]|uniref:Uncharacterized protein n=1 Tax=Streptomyces rugosispiralis TaxID=2967341 RepID=A0ABT1VD79_9ACTN|nr:hypothetical protein [Streptomyces rugosispiralis]MCQ8195350.1 hypothetical protein [Streptomyces rugosispiralis]